jgi:hypothetical protein
MMLSQPLSAYLTEPWPAEPLLIIAPRAQCSNLHQTAFVGPHAAERHYQQVDWAPSCIIMPFRNFRSSLWLLSGVPLS